MYIYIFIYIHCTPCPVATRRQSGVTTCTARILPLLHSGVLPCIVMATVAAAEVELTALAGKRP